MIPDAIAYIQTDLNGKPYDYIFDITDDTYYCSEIIYEGLKIGRQLTGVVLLKTYDIQ